MFEDSTFESNGRIRTRSRSWMVAAFVFNGSILLALILIPLIYPEALPRQVSLLLEAPRPPAPQQPAPPPRQAQAFRGVPQMDDATIIAPRIIPITIAEITGPEAPAPMNGLPLGSEDSNAAAEEAFQGQRHVSVAAATPKGPVHLSSGVVSGLLLKKTTPIYPQIAVARARRGDRRARGRHLGLRNYPEAARGQRPPHAAAGRDGRGQQLALSAFPAQRPAGRGGDHDHCDFHAPPLSGFHRRGERG